MFDFLKLKSSGGGGMFMSFSDSNSRFNLKRSRKDGKKKWRTCGSMNNMERVMTSLGETDRTADSGSKDMNGSGRTNLTSSNSNSSIGQSSTDTSCNFSLINHTRRRWNARLHPLQRSRDLDAIAEKHVKEMAAAQTAFHSDPTELHASLQRKSVRRLGQNIVTGEDALDMHVKQVRHVTNYTNMVDGRYTEVGVATARARSGEYYLCVILLG